MSTNYTSSTKTFYTPDSPIDPSDTGSFKDFDFGSSLAKIMLGEVDPYNEARTDYAVFAPKVLKSEDTGESIKLQPFQMEVIRALKSSASLVLFILPRGFAKSSLVTIGYSAWTIGNDHNTRLIVASNTKDQAVSHLHGIETVLEDRDYQEIYGDLLPHNRKVKWAEDVKYITHRTIRMRDATMRAAGVGSAEVLGKRCSLLVVDDLIDESHADSEAERDSAWRWFSGQLKYTQSGVPNARTIVINTRFHHDDLAARLKERHKGDPDFICIDIPALVSDPATGEEKSIWEDRFPTEHLLKERERSYFSFMSHFMNDPIDVSKSRLQESWLGYIDHTTVDLSGMQFFAAVDPNTGKDSIAKDYFAVAIVGVHLETKRVYIVDLLYTKADLQVVKEQFRAKMDQWHPSVVGLEANAAQGLYATILSDGEHASYPFDLIYNVMSKEQRILSMANHFIAGKVSILGSKDEHGRWHPIPSLEPIRREWVTFPNAKSSHLDALDALEMALRPIFIGSGGYILSVITPEEFRGRILEEQSLRSESDARSVLVSGMAETIREADLSAPMSPPAPETEITDEMMKKLEDEYFKARRPKSWLGTIGGVIPPLVHR